MVKSLGLKDPPSSFMTLTINVASIVPLLPAGATEPTVVTLPAGKSASTVLEASAVPQGDDPPCKDYSLMVTPPGQTEPVSAGPAQIPDCDVQVHPVVAGDTGGR